MNALTLSVVLVLLLPLSANAYEIPRSDCEASAEATLEHREQVEDETKLRFTVTISSTEDCADVAYDLIIEEWMTNDQTHRIRISRDAHLEGHAVKETVEHVLLAGYRLLEYEARVAVCTRCEAEP